MIENLNLDNAQKEVTVTNMELDKKGEPKVTTEEVAIGLTGENIQPGKTGDLLPGQAAEGDHDGRDGDPELINFLMADKDKYIKVEIRADIVDGKPVISDTGKHLIWAKFLRPGWKLLNRIKGNVSVNPLTGILIGDDINYNENIIRYLLKEWNLPLQLIFGFDINGNEIVSNFDAITGISGVNATLLYELVGKVKNEVVSSS